MNINGVRQRVNRLAKSLVLNIGPAYFVDIDGNRQLATYENMVRDTEEWFEREVRSGKLVNLGNDF